MHTVYLDTNMHTQIFKYTQTYCYEGRGSRKSLSITASMWAREKGEEEELHDSKLEVDDICPPTEGVIAERKGPEWGWFILAPAGAKQGETRVLKKGWRSLSVEMLVTVSIRWPGLYFSTLLFRGPFWNENVSVNAYYIFIPIYLILWLICWLFSKQKLWITRLRSLVLRHKVSIKWLNTLFAISLAILAMWGTKSQLLRRIVPAPSKVSSAFEVGMGPTNAHRYLEQYKISRSKWKQIHK